MITNIFMLQISISKKLTNQYKTQTAVALLQAYCGCFQKTTIIFLFIATLRQFHIFED